MRILLYSTLFNYSKRFQREKRDNRLLIYVVVVRENVHLCTRKIAVTVSLRLYLSIHLLIICNRDIITNIFSQKYKSVLLYISIIMNVLYIKSRS